MADLGGRFDASQGEGMEERDTLPAGTYTAQLAKADVKDAKNYVTTGNRYINLEFEVTDGERKGARFWSMLNLWNQNATAVQISQRELTSLCRACGKLQVSNTDELIGIPIEVKLGVKTDAQYGSQNTVKAYKPIGQMAPPDNGPAKFGAWPSGATGKPVDDEVPF